MTEPQPTGSQPPGSQPAGTPPSGTRPAGPVTLAAPVARVLAALADLDADTAARVATHAGMGYSTVTPKLRALEEQGLAERFKAGDGTTQWRATDTGRAHHSAETAGQPPTSNPITAPTDDETAEDEPADEPTTGDVAPTWTASPGEPVPPAPRATAGDPAEEADALEAEPDRQPETPEPTPEGEPTLNASLPSPDAPDDGTEAGTSAPEPAGDRQDSVAAEVANPGGARAARRPKGVLAGLVRQVLLADPDKTFTVGKICQAINDAHAEDPSVARASGGAVANACFKLVAAHAARLVVDKPATFQAEPPTT
jgi:hypothetical protein